MRGRFNERRDVRDMRSKNRFIRLGGAHDPDILPTRLDDDDQEPSFQVRVNRQSVNTINRQLGAGGSGMQRMTGGGQNKFTTQNRKVDHRSRIQQQAIAADGGVRKDVVMVFQIKVKHGGTYGLSWIVKQLGSRVEDFKPILPEVDQQNNASFYVKDAEQAESIMMLSNRIRHKETNTALRMWKNEVVAPWRRLSAADVELLNAVIDSRYNGEARALDLAEFSADKRLTGFMFRLTSNNVMLHVLDRIDECYGHLTALSLKSNKLDSLDCTSMLLWATKFVKVLDLSSNEIRKMDQVAKLKGLPVEMVFLEGNPLCDEFTRSSDYLSAVHNIFPRVNMLDGNAVTPILTGVDPLDVGIEPLYRPSYFGDQPQVKELIEGFLLRFYEIYDGDNPLMDRKKLADAYHDEESMFTLTLQNFSNASGKSWKYHPEECFHAYIRQSHNLKQLDKWDTRRAERVHVGAMSIVVALAKLPKTSHLKDSFTLDVSLVTSTLMAFSLSGLFEDGPGVRSGDVPELKYFNRQFVVAPRDASSLVIISDMLFISSLHPPRLEKFKKLQEKAAKNALAPSTSQTMPIVSAVVDVNLTQPPPPIAQMPINGEPDNETKLEMIKQFSQQSGMKPDWSEKCLQDSNWNFEQAGQNFLVARATIPADAFV
ncbi:unnamed protein product, partial [Mesorhabditis belari]|uniref:Nuclear RNA export factor 1 n=1 Tax=Mesorhabditis belari TaxID=2138241 RepID=A0AAF3F163_9BILA